MKKSMTSLLARYFRKACRIVRQHGVKGLYYKTLQKLTRRYQYRRFIARTRATPAELDAQRQAVFPVSPRISLLVPLFNTPEVFLRELIENVQGQTYANWQLCLADGSTEPGDRVERTVRSFASADPRIAYVRLAQNLGISGNTNACLRLATGDYIGLFDHDDLLAPEALHEVVKAINETGADFLYTDELNFEHTPDQVTNIHFKPDFAIDNLRSNNYICHFSVFTRELIERVGDLDDRFNGSQDYDIILRLTEQARRIHHIPRVLYYWRVHSASVASDLSAKPYAIAAARGAVKAHLDRVGLRGTVVDSTMLSTYKINYEVPAQPHVSILVLATGTAGQLKACLDSVRSHAGPCRCELVVADPGTGASEGLEPADSLRVLRLPAGTSWAAALNEAAGICTGDFLLFLDSHLTVMTPDWLTEMVMFAQRTDVGAVGVKVSSRNQTIIHAGIGLGLCSLAGSYFHGSYRRDPGYVSRLTYAQNVSAVSGGCLMTTRSLFLALGGFDPAYRCAFHDIDYCLRARQAGRLIVFTPYAELVICTRDYRRRNAWAAGDTDAQRFQTAWRSDIEQGDPYYNRNLSPANGDFSPLVP